MDEKPPLTLWIGAEIRYQSEDMLLPSTARVEDLGPVGIRINDKGFVRMLSVRSDWIRVQDAQGQERKVRLPEFEVNYDEPDKPLELFEE